PLAGLSGMAAPLAPPPISGPKVAEQVRAFKAGDADRAREIDAEPRPAYELLAITTNPIPIKAALALLGHEVGGHRLPLVPPSADELDRVRSCLSRLRLLVAA